MMFQGTFLVVYNFITKGVCGLAFVVANPYSQTCMMMLHHGHCGTFLIVYNFHHIVEGGMMIATPG